MHRAGKLHLGLGPLPPRILKRKCFILVVKALYSRSNYYFTHSQTQSHGRKPYFKETNESNLSEVHRLRLPPRGSRTTHACTVGSSSSSSPSKGREWANWIVTTGRVKRTTFKTHCTLVFTEVSRAAGVGHCDCASHSISPLFSNSCISLCLSTDLAARAPHTFSSECQRSPCSSSPVACGRSSRWIRTWPWALLGA